MLINKKRVYLYVITSYSIHYTKLYEEAEVPWAWGINGCLSVLSTALATIIAVEAGFVAVQCTAAAAYAVAALARMRS